MNRLLYYGSVEAIPFYNCSWKSEWFETGVKRPFLGYSIMIFGVFIEFLYPPIIYLIFKTKLIRHSCYKIIVFLSIIDMIATVCSCFISGSLFIQGAVFCSYPSFIYITGTIVLTTWCTSCACTLFLFINRIVNITLPQYSDLIEAKLAYFSIILSIIYGFYYVFFTPTLCFNSGGMAWFPDPFSEKEPSKEAAEYYKNRSQGWHNWIFVTAMVLLYVIYFLKVRKIARGQKSKASTAILVQCIIICFFNTTCALIYNSFTLITPDPWVLLLGQYCWCVNHGCPALIYITINDTIRKGFRKLLFNGTRVEDTTAVSVAVTNTNNNI
ncbi:Serpentine Receptor, class T [Caenorhabditis elegans]|uniref:Serpentine Receptor, class T n=1 Tax=Caenorhabditis elegans TaxID=6239 RepID=Q9U2H5_CAEEL|nr:Serpentine Receptor, class T [Caenorhabditis elegans]CAB63364.3 Serpentine Receptor, class T [Caenorhabditis elegans]|eukprot:NP_502821.3 Serpentine Receptor, class T [Caenorhabditis elegans]